VVLIAKGGGGDVPTFSAKGVLRGGVPEGAVLDTAAVRYGAMGSGARLPEATVCRAGLGDGWGRRQGAHVAHSRTTTWASHALDVGPQRTWCEKSGAGWCGVARTRACSGNQSVRSFCSAPV
jgi:hypothetical protein